MNSCAIKEEKAVNIALLGFGTVGSGVYDLLLKNYDNIKNKYGEEVNIKHILVRNVSKRSNHKSFELFTDDFCRIVEDEHIDLVIEVLGGVHPAYEYIKKSLQQKRYVITANKEVIALHGKELMQEAQKNGVALLYEASVAAAIPIIDIMTRALAGDEILEITGIINGTTNFILTEMKEKRISFNAALKIAQESGYAESCPDSDILGLDVARKLVILTFLAYGVYIAVDSFNTEGIEKISFNDIEYADRLGYEIKLLAISRKEQNKVSAVVAPFLVSKEQLLASVKGVNNAVMVKCDAADDMLFIGKGAGKYPTASAIMGNIIHIITNKSYNPINNTVKSYSQDLKEQLYKYHIRFETPEAAFMNNALETYLCPEINSYKFIDNNVIIITEKCSGKIVEQLIDKLKAVYNVQDFIKIRVF